MKKCIILCFHVDDYSIYELDEMTEQERYEVCKSNLTENTEIITVYGLCGCINDEMFNKVNLNEYYIYPYYVEEEEYDQYK